MVVIAVAGFCVYRLHGIFGSITRLAAVLCPMTRRV